MKIRYLGGGQEVGRAAIMVDTGTKYVFDYGMLVQDASIPIPPPPDTHCIFLSHAHLDHSGGLPILYSTGFRGRTYMTRTTLNLIDLLLRDSLKVQNKRGNEPDFNTADIFKTIQSSQTVGLERTVKVKDGTATFYDAGHIPGSASILLETNGKRILYTGDINFMETPLMHPAFSDFDDIDVLITECTYSYKNHPDRSMLVEQLRKRVTETVHRGGTALLPAFAVGRTQETLLAVSSLGFPITMDGMGITATQAILMERAIASPGKLSKAFEHARKIRRGNQRFAALKTPGIVITTSGMLQGGPIAYYIDKLQDRKDCSLTLLGYQIEGMPGRTLMETGRFMTEEVDIEPKFDISFMDFSSHASRDSIIELIEKISPKKTLLFHGDHALEFKEKLQDRGIDVEAPANGESLQL
ncbi:MAG: MBL fold metallo-hydrolase [Candidatus Aenigmatarchaeota archaeon]